jgi:hypothetical protein
MKMVSGQIQRLVTVLLILAAIIPLSTGCSTSLLNQPPTISSLTTNVEQVNPLGSANISCDARDPDRDQLTYTWSDNGGTISGEGPAVTWTAPQTAGVYTITVTVDDGKSSKATKEVTVAVLVVGNSPPVVQSLTYVPVTFTYDDEIATFTCVATDPDGDKITSYTWSSVDEKGEPSGSFQGTGVVVKWTPPIIPTEIFCTVSVFCTDAVGNRSGRKFIAMHVLCDCLRPEVSGK